MPHLVLVKSRGAADVAAVQLGGARCPAARFAVDQKRVCRHKWQVSMRSLVGPFERRSIKLVGGSSFVIDEKSS
jgi:hypothetical protein